MSQSTSTESKPRFPVLPLIACVVTFGLGISLLLMQRSDDPNASVASEPPEITTGEAARIRAIVDQENSGLPFATTNRGRVVEVSDQGITVRSEGQQATWPLAADTQIWKNREAIDVQDIQPGDTVDVDFQQRGSRSDGWVNTAVKINVNSDEPPDTTDSSQHVMPTTEVSGVVVEAGAGVIAIEDADGLRSTYPLQQTALVLDGSDTIALNDLAVGEQVTLTTQESGSRTDGWIVTVSHIERQQ